MLPISKVSNFIGFLLHSHQTNSQIFKSCCFLYEVSKVIKVILGMSGRFIYLMLPIYLAYKTMQIWKNSLSYNLSFLSFLFPKLLQLMTPISDVHNEDDNFIIDFFTGRESFCVKTDSLASLQTG